MGIDDYKKMGMSNTKITKLLNVSEYTIRNKLKELKDKEPNKKGTRFIFKRLKKLIKLMNMK